MIIVPDDQPSKQGSDTKLGLEAAPDAEEPPPTYTPLADPAGGGSEDPPPNAIPFKTKPTNFLSLFNEHDAIRGEFVIDPSIRIPAAVLPPLGEGDTDDARTNLCLRSKDSSVHAEIWLLGAPKEITADAQGHTPRRTTVALTSGHGSIHAQVHTLDSPAPFSLTATAPHGSVGLLLPRSFEGLLCLATRHGSIALSDALVQHATQLSQVGDTRRYFVGNFELLGDKAWLGDQVEVEAVHGSIRMRYVDEALDGRRRKGLLSRLFGR